MKNLLIFHSALAPYRLDFFNTLADNYNCHIVFLSRNNRNQPFNQKELLSKARFTYSFMDIKIVIKNRDFNIGYLYHIIKYKPDIIIGGEYGLPVLIPYFYKKLFRQKYTIYTICDDSLKIAQECKGIRAKLRSYLVHKLDGFIFISSQVSQWYKENFKIKKKIIVFPIIKEENNYQLQLKKSLPISISFQDKFKLKGKKIILYIGRLTEVKNLNLLINAYKQIANPNYTLILVGEGNQKKQLQEKVQKLNLSNQVLFVGRYEGNELYAWYNLANIFVLPSVYEPFGAVTAEALQAGCPVLCSQNAGSAELIKNNINGHLFDPQNENQLAILLKEYINNAPNINLNQIRSSILITTFESCKNKLIQSLK
ncbi:glycosyltransferase family 4 protein [Phocaeicola sp. KGMB11183]|uniref:Glycosyltransferase family 4 protein n=1 Tax=Phocaeicola acetigenes TaxID=3016083 RepID=A0ABT4PHC0_9BACT|nr:glycosyltransferase family 4 protein [Phocaeicola sp. KGMB11183]MCZ8372452.1 glycosyltransferase family 4 protein [Phocaeicola sp. KGMB11183]